MFHLKSENVLSVLELSGYLFPPELLGMQLQVLGEGTAVSWEGKGILSSVFSPCLAHWQSKE